MHTTEAILKDLLKEAGFRKGKSRRWFLDQHDLWVELELQRSRYGGRSFINIGLHLEDPFEGREPDVYTRIDVWLDRYDLAEMLRDENPKLEEEFSVLTENVIIPFVQQLTTAYMRSPEGHALLDLAQTSREAAEFFHYA